MTHPDSDKLPRLSRDRAFWGATLTQFLGAFNDNLFKQLVLLIATDYLIFRQTQLGETDAADVFQPTALALFAIPFVLFSGFAGWLSDRISKRKIFLAAKVGEIGIMLLGMAAFAAGGSDLFWLLVLLCIVLFCMSTQSAFFGPGKYGILPELFRDSDLPKANGTIQMTTFLAIIFGMALAGFAKDWFEGRLWMVSLMCVGIAVVGTLTALLIRSTPVADPDLPFEPGVLLVTPATRRLLFRDRELLGVLVVSSVFWFLGGVVQPAVNAIGKIQMGIGDSRTSVAAAFMGIGIAAGCVLCGRLSRGRVDFRLTKLGAWGVTVTLIALTAFGLYVEGTPTPPGREGMWELIQTVYPGELPLRVILTLLGVSAGLFIVPMQVFLQVHPPEEQKGRIIGAMNLFNWVGIVLSAFFYTAAERTCAGLGVRFSWTFAVLAVFMGAVALFYRPKSNSHADGDN